LEFVDPGEDRDLLLRARAGGVVLDYAIVTSDEDLGDSEILRRVVLFTARGLCVVRRLSPGPNDPDEPVDIERVGQSGYGGAFLYPPYDITLLPRAAQDLFFAIDDRLLKRPDAETQIWKFESGWYPEDAWSPYFEWNWWGSCMWTVRTGPGEVVVIGASASD
jgi:hypothetical protein